MLGSRVLYHYSLIWHFKEMWDSMNLNRCFSQFEGENVDVWFVRTWAKCQERVLMVRSRLVSEDTSVSWYGWCMSICTSIYLLLLYDLLGFLFCLLFYNNEIRARHIFLKTPLINSTKYNLKSFDNHYRFQYSQWIRWPTRDGCKPH